MKKWQTVELGEDCPQCGGTLEVYTDAEDGCFDGDDVRCQDCNYRSSASVDETGLAWVQDSDDVNEIGDMIGKEADKKLSKKLNQ